MKLCKSDVPDSSQISASVVNGEESRQFLHRRPAGLTIRVRGIDCTLADIQVQIERLRQERTYSETRAGRIGRYGTQVKRVITV